MSAVNESLVRDIVSEVLSRLNGAAQGQPASAAGRSPAKPDCGCNGNGNAKVSTGSPGLRGRFGIFQDADEACAAAQEAYLQLQQKGVGARRKVEEIVKALADKNAAEWGRMELEETKIGRLDHKIEKLKIISL